jgi:hypothetical protein
VSDFIIEKTLQSLRGEIAMAGSVNFAGLGKSDFRDEEAG